MQAASSSEDAAEQPSIKISVPQGLDAKIHVRDEEDLETVLANLELLARRKGFDTEILSPRSVEQGQQEPLADADKDLLGWLEQLDEDIGTVEGHIQDLDQRVDRVEDEFGGGEDSQLAEIMDRLEELDESIEDMPDDVSRHLGELREEISSLSDEVEELEDYTASLDDDLEGFRQRISEIETEGSDEDSEQVEKGGETVEEDSDDEDEVDEEAGGLYGSVEEFRDMDEETRKEEIFEVIDEKQPVDTSGICEALFGFEAGSGSREYAAVQEILSNNKDDLEKEKDGRTVLYSLSDEEEGDSTEPEEQGEDSVDEEDAETETEGLYGSVESFKKLRDDQRANQIKEVIRENGPIDTSGICRELFGFEAESGTTEYTFIQNALQDFRDELETEKDGRSTLYDLPKVRNQETSESQKTPQEPDVGTEVENGEPAEPVETTGGPVEPEGGDDDQDFSDHDGRYSLEELQEDEDLNIEAEVLKIFQEHGPISVPEATEILFGSEASSGDDEYRIVWNQLAKHDDKDRGCVEEIPREDEDGEVRYEVHGPFKICNLYYESRHKFICLDCAPDPGECVFFEKQGAVDHRIETKEDDDIVGKHNSFVSAFLPAGFHNKPETIEEIVDRECGNE
jgi:predicted  nucleic acid-binding Zn-ribbon protein